MLICLTGLPGSGKSISANIFKAHGFKIIEMSSFIRQMMKKQKIAITNKNLRNFSARMRKKYGKTIVAKLTAEKIESLLKKSAEKNRKIVINGVRSMQEIRYFKKEFEKIYIIAIISNEKTRYARIVKRARQDDIKSYNDFLWREKKEISWGLKQVIRNADILIFNNSTKQELKRNINSLTNMKHFILKY